MHDFRVKHLAEICHFEILDLNLFTLCYKKSDAQKCSWRSGAVCTYSLKPSVAVFKRFLFDFNLTIRLPLVFSLWVAL